MNLRTGADYRETLRDGRRIYIMGEGRVDDVVTHSATRGMVEEYVAWYDRHRDPAWKNVLFRSDGIPWAYVVPQTTADLRGLANCIARTTFPSAGNITHTPLYGHLIAMGVHHATVLRNPSAKNIQDAEDYRALIAATGRFLTFSAGAATIGQRLNPDPKERTALRMVRETDKGMVISGKIGMHTSPAYAEDVYVGGHSGVDFSGHRASFVVAVNAPGVTVLCRKASVRDGNPFVAPLSNRYDELDGQMWLDNVLVPWERVFLHEPAYPEPVALWLFWHQLYCWLAKLEFTLGLGLASAQAMGLKDHEPTIDMLVDMIVEVQTVRSCQTAAELDPGFTPVGRCYPNHLHVAVGSLALLKARQRVTELLRMLPGSSLVVAPTDRDLDNPELAAGLEASFGGGGWTARQRAALLQMAWDHIGSALDARESTFELHANGGAATWRGRLRRAFDDYNALADGAMAQLGMAMPKADLGSIKAAAMAPRRVVTPVTGKT
jgi:4-hydroxyphenylacetate 3-monooxygenase